MFDKKKKKQVLESIYKYDGDHLKIIRSYRDKKDDITQEVYEKIDELVGQGWTVSSSYTEHGPIPVVSDGWWFQVYYVLTK